MRSLQSQKGYTLEISDYVFHALRTNLPWKNDQAIRKVYWYPAIKRAELDKRSVYQTRHIFASLALSSGENFMWVSKRLGHDKPTTTLRFYGRYINQVDSQCGLKLESIMQNQNGAR